MKKCIAICIVLFAGQLLAQTSAPRASVVINKDRRGLQVVVSNTQDKDFLCRGVRVDTKLCDDNFCQNVGRVSVPFENVYLRKRSDAKFNIGKDELADVRRENPDSIVTDANVDVVCVEATFPDYCKYAEKDEKEEFAMRALIKEARTENCDKIEREVGSDLDLDRTEIVSIKPIGFLNGLKYLSLNSNRVVFVEDLKYLKNLTQLELAENPIEDIRPLFMLPKLKRLFVSNTLVRSIAGIQNAKALKEIDLDGSEVRSLEPLLKSTVTCAHYRSVPALDTQDIVKQLFERYVAGGSCW